MGKVAKRYACRLCKSSDMIMVLQLTPTPLADSYITAGKLNDAQEVYPLDLLLCNDCGNVQLLDVVDPEILYSNFVYETATSPGLVEHFRKAADEIMQRVKPQKNAFVVDIGSNDGSLLKFFKVKGMRVLGIDPAKDIALKAISLGIETLPKFFNSNLAREIKAKYGHAYIITSNNTIANIDNLADFVEGVKILLDKNGVFVFETGYVLDLVQKCIFDNIYHEHLSYFSVKPLQKFLQNNGLELIDAQRIAPKGGSLRCFAQHANGPRKVMQPVHNLIEIEAKQKLHEPETFKTLAVKLDNSKNDIQKLLNELKSKGKIIAGYGASHSVTTVIYNFGIGSILSFIVDDNPKKQGTHSPGFHIPVLPSEALYEKKPDYVVILAWRFAEQIIKKHKKFLDKGRHFITILPKVEIK